MSPNFDGQSGAAPYSGLILPALSCLSEACLSGSTFERDDSSTGEPHRSALRARLGFGIRAATRRQPRRVRSGFLSAPAPSLRFHRHKFRRHRSSLPPARRQNPISTCSSSTTRSSTPRAPSNARPWKPRPGSSSRSRPSAPTGARSISSSSTPPPTSATSRPTSRRRKRASSRSTSGNIFSKPRSTSAAR